MTRPLFATGFRDQRLRFTHNDRLYMLGGGRRHEHTMREPVGYGITRRSNVQQQTPDDDGQYGASLESLARDETRPTKYPTHLRGSGRVSEATKRSMVGKRPAKDLRRRPSGRIQTTPRSTIVHPSKKEETEKDCKL